MHVVATDPDPAFTQAPFLDAWLKTIVGRPNDLVEVTPGCWVHAACLVDALNEAALVVLLDEALA